MENNMTIKQTVRHQIDTVGVIETDWVKFCEALVDNARADERKLVCEHDYKNPVRKGRAHLCCPKCDKDITLEMVFIYEATEQSLSARRGDTPVSGETK